jgi:hypothetical protein
MLIELLILLEIVLIGLRQARTQMHRKGVAVTTLPAVLKEGLTQTILLRQFFSMLIGFGFKIGLPARTPTNMPLPDSS